jgi:Glycosyltransferase Family 4
MTKPIKLLECIRQGQIGGGESHLLSLVRNLDRTRFDPVVLSFTDGPMVEQLKAMDVATRVIHTEKPFDVSKWSEVKDFLFQQQVELVHAHGTRACSNVMRAARSLGIPVVYTVHGWSFHADQPLLTRVARIMGERYLTSRATVNIAV